MQKWDYPIFLFENSFCVLLTYNISEVISYKNFNDPSPLKLSYHVLRFNPSPRLPVIGSSIYLYDFCFLILLESLKDMRLGSICFSSINIGDIIYYGDIFICVQIKIALEEICEKSFRRRQDSYGNRSEFVRFCRRTDDH